MKKKYVVKDSYTVTRWTVVEIEEEKIVEYNYLYEGIPAEATILEVRDDLEDAKEWSNGIDTVSELTK